MTLRTIWYYYSWKDPTQKYCWTRCSKHDIDLYRNAGSMVGKINILKSKAFKSKLVQALLKESV